MAKKTFKDIKGAKKPVTKSVRIVLDPDVGVQYNEAKLAYDNAKVMSDAVPADKALRATANGASDAFDAALEAIEENSVLFTFRALARTGLDDIIAEHPPTPKQKKAAEQRGEEANWNSDTFPPALMAACCIEPELTPEDAQEMWDSPDWNQAELLSLFATALEVQQTRRVVDLKKDSTPTLSSD